MSNEQYKYLQDFVVDLRNIFLSLHLYDIFLDLDLKHCLLSVGIRYSLERKSYSDYENELNAENLVLDTKGFCEDIFTLGWELFRFLMICFVFG